MQDDGLEPKKIRGEDAIDGTIEENPVEQQNDEFFELHDLNKKKGLGRNFAAKLPSHPGRNI